MHTYIRAFTPQGPKNNRGVNFRALGHLFDLTQQRQKDTWRKVHYNITVSVVEIYNEQANDLLAGSASAPNAASYRNMDIRQGPQGPYIPGAYVCMRYSCTGNMFLP